MGEIYTILLKNPTVPVDEQRRILTEAFTEAGIENARFSGSLGLVWAKADCSDDQKATLEKKDLSLERATGIGSPYARVYN